MLSVFSEFFKSKTLPSVSLQAVMTLTEWSERTLRRRIADGSVQCTGESGANNKSLIRLDAIVSELCIRLTAEDIEVLARADAGEAAAQTDLAVLFLSHGKTKSAVYWLEQAAKQSFPDAMQWLGWCYLLGDGVAEDEHLALMYFAKAAALGHGLAKLQIEAMRPGEGEQ